MAPVTMARALNAALLGVVYQTRSAELLAQTLRERAARSHELGGTA